jgi:hypothetical protein
MQEVKTLRERHWQEVERFCSQYNVPIPQNFVMSANPPSSASGFYNPSPSPPPTSGPRMLPSYNDHLTNAPFYPPDPNITTSQGTGTRARTLGAEEIYRMMGQQPVPVSTVSIDSFD